MNVGIDVKSAIEYQKRLATLVKMEGKPDVKTIAGVDVAYFKPEGKNIAAAALFIYPGLELLDVKYKTGETDFPYIPGLLSFREVGVIVDLLAPISDTIDLILVDGQGIAHPRRVGLASHLGILLNKPTIGVAKSRLVGEYEEPGPHRGDKSPLTDKGERIGTVLRTRDNVRPLFISIGYKVSLYFAEEIVMNCGGGYRLPEPTRIADKEVTRLRKELFG
jgi:deoxyribonuclease V